MGSRINLAYRCTDEPRREPLPMLANTSSSTWIKKGSAAMLSSIQPAGVTPELNLRITQTRKHGKRDPPWFWNSGWTSPEAQNRGISGPMKRTWDLQKKFSKKKVFRCSISTCSLLTCAKLATPLPPTPPHTPPPQTAHMFMCASWVALHDKFMKFKCVW